MKKVFSGFLFGCFCLLTLINASAEIKLPALFTDNMVLQQQSSDPVWGWANPGAEITVTGSWNQKTVKTKASKDGSWMVEVNTPEAGGPYTLTIRGEETIILKNVLIGEVWICSGQSNMEMPVKGWVGAPILHAAEEIEKADYPKIRLFKVARKVAFTPQEDCKGYWSLCSPETVENFSATAYFFGQQLYKKLDIPIGLIETCWGGTVAEAWTSRDALEKFGGFEKELAKVDSVKQHIKTLQTKQKNYVKEWQNYKDSIVEKYKEPDFDASKWEDMKLPTSWEQAGYPGLDGNIWYRKIIEVPQSWIGKDLTLSLGPIDDNDITWFNGHKIGSTKGWQAGRNYTIPGELVKAGQNVIAVRVTDIHANGGIYGNAKLLRLYPSDASPSTGVSLAGNWKFKVALVKHNMSSLKNPNIPSVLFNGMIHPLIPFGIRGAIWYQGEANVGRAEQYAKLFPTMIKNWRQKWGEGKFPFYYAQIAPYPYGSTGMLSAALRDAQRKTLSVPHTGMVVTLDIGDTTNIHPANKEEVGRRFSLWALNKIYGRKKMIFSGPLYRNMEIKGNQAVISFHHVAGGLTSKNKDLVYFEIAGENSEFVPAEARIKGNHVIVESSKIKHPTAVRFAWRDKAVPHLFNTAGLPASSFSTVSFQSLAWKRASKLGMGVNLSWLENYWNGKEKNGFKDYLDVKSISDKKEQLALMHQLGFETVRLPVSFDHWASRKPPYKILKTDYFAAIDSILKWAKLYHLNVIIDNHHGSLNKYENVMKALVRLKAIWKQVATRYKNTNPEHVFFELYNEPHGMSNAEWTKCAKQLIKTIREIAPKHTLIVGGADRNSISGLQEMGKLPFDNIIYTFHFYDPFLFTHQGAEWAGEKAMSNVGIPFPYSAGKMPTLNPKSKGTYGASLYHKYRKMSSKSYLKNELLKVKEFSEDHGVPVFCGEWGSYKKYADTVSRCRYTTVVKKILNKLKIPFAYWEWNHSFSFFNGKPAIHHISDGMKEAWGFNY